MRLCLFFFLYRKTNVDSSDYAAVISICDTWGKSVLGNTDQMHEKCIFDVVEWGVGGWMMGKQSEGEMGGRDVWGFHFFCADVALGSCSMACCFAFSPLLPPSNLSSLSFPLLCLYFHSSLTVSIPLFKCSCTQWFFFSLILFNKLTTTTKKNLSPRQLVLCCNSEKKGKRMEEWCG